MNNHTVVIVPSLPSCDFCANQAKYDGLTTIGPWGNMCGSHFRQYHTGLGLGIGQQLMTPEQYLDWFWKKSPENYNRHYTKGITTEELANKLFRIYHDNPKDSDLGVLSDYYLRDHKSKPR